MKQAHNRRVAGIALAAALLTVPLQASSVEDLEPSPELQDEEEIALLLQIDEKAVTCGGGRTCWGKMDELFSRVLIQQGKVRLVLESGPLKNLMVSYGCEETWSLWMHDEMANRDLMLNQMTVAEALAQTVWVIFKKDASAGHCDVDWIYRNVTP